MNFTGQCQQCDGPDFYLLEPKQSQPVNNNLVLQECLPCEGQFYDCFGDDDVKAKTGYQLYVNQSLAAVKCELLNSYQLCFENNTCREGYQGLGCKQCAPDFFRDFDGSCQKCSPQVIEAIPYNV